jgi:peptidyl-prolyl cis-trans isomerase D
MSVLESLRQRSGLLVAIVGIALLTFVLTGLLERGSLGGPDTTVGEIAGKPIEYNVFNKKVEEAVENKKRSLGKATLTDKETEDVVQEVWNMLINEEVMLKEYEELGITVSPDELYDIMVEHPSPYFVRYLTDPNTGKVNPAFTDPNTGQISPAKIREFAQSMAPEQETQWVQLEELMRQVRIIEKYNALVKKGMYVTTSQAKRLFTDQNSEVSIKYVLKGYSSVADNKVKVTDEDLNEYYTKHKNEFKQEDSRNIEYVSFDIAPSQEDEKEILTAMQQVAEKLKENKTFSDDSLLVVAESDYRMFDMSYNTKGTLSPQIDSLMFEEKEGFVVGPYIENGYVKVSKLMDSKLFADSAKVRHILIAYSGSGADPSITRTKEQAKTLADSLQEVLTPKKTKKKEKSERGAGFTELVEKYSDDGGKRRPENKKEDEDYQGKGGNYGWVNDKSPFVPEFKEAALKGDEGDITVVESQFGYHIIEILDSKGSEKKVQVASVERKLEPSNKTMQAIFAKASEFAGKYNTLELFQQAVTEQKLNKRIAEKIKENDKIIPGIESSRPLIKWIYENEKGMVSDPKDLGGRYVVAAITEINEKGFAPLEQVKDEVTENVIKEKKAELLVGEINEAKKGASAIENIASKLGLSASSANNINFNSNSIEGIGNDLGFVGAVSAMKERTMSAPLVGKAGVMICYADRVSSVPLPKEYNKQVSQELSKLQMRVDFEEVFKALKENANVQDHLVKFY